MPQVTGHLSCHMQSARLGQQGPKCMAARHQQKRFCLSAPSHSKRKYHACPEIQRSMPPLTWRAPVQDSRGLRAWLPDTSNSASAGDVFCRGARFGETPARANSRCAMPCAPLSCMSNDPLNIPRHTSRLFACAW